MNWVFLVLLSAVLLAAADIIRKFVLKREHPLEFLAARGFFAVLVLFALVPWVSTDIDGRILGLIYLAALVATMGNYFQVKAQRHTDISYLSPLQSLTPIFLLIIAYLYLRETVTVVQFLGIVAIVVGAYTLTVAPGKEFALPFQEFKKEYWLHIWLSVVLLAIAAALDKYMLGMVRPITYLFFGWLFMNLNYIMINLWLYDWNHISVDIKKGWHWLLLAAVCIVGSGLSFFGALSMPGVLISLALPLRYVSVLLETFFGGRLFHERNLAHRLVACVVMLVGVVLVVR